LTEPRAEAGDNAGIGPHLSRSGEAFQLANNNSVLTRQVIGLALTQVAQRGGRVRVESQTNVRTASEPGFPPLEPDRASAKNRTSHCFDYIFSTMVRSAYLNPTGVTANSGII
jgi:hypothetical protein